MDTATTREVYARQNINAVLDLMDRNLKAARETGEAFSRFAEVVRETAEAIDYWTQWYEDRSRSDG